MIKCRNQRWFFPVLVLFAVLTLAGACRSRDPIKPELSSQGGQATLHPDAKSQPGNSIHKDIGFKSRRHLEDHYEKHGAEFNGLTREQYLAAAQELRDAPVGGNILEARRPDGTVSRFDRSTGAFLAFDSNLTIRTFFKPNDGERYFKRQINREH